MGKNHVRFFLRLSFDLKWTRVVKKIKKQRMRLHPPQTSTIKTTSSLPTHPTHMGAPSCLRDGAIAPVPPEAAAAAAGSTGASLFIVSGHIQYVVNENDPAALQKILGKFNR